ncbi:protein phosphatase 2C domain-containing protein [Lipingzhangella sp. LS1_29]|uniref:Protein phosphatase 2C domain-containing protein n=1 Tax=Lipingzhangella rawalii TaxID=2055835 RepID=A0ABU2H8J9_9ACTN|nr:protein phosphatase 2C domain-containing protein [Lipingzhangella rawalii]MDS1271643.1 protein phosphatase 2C domain-containing protein [Lipingzhangella rawalii]
MSSTNATELCPGCSEPTHTGDAFCEGCGHRLDGEVAPEVQCAWCSEVVVDGYCVACGLAQPKEGDHIEIASRYAAGVCDIGRRYRTNQDSLSVRSAPDRPLVAAVVCDGVSSSPKSEVAAQAAATAGTETLLAEFPSDADGHRATSAALSAAARAAAEIADSPNQAPACTYVSAVVAADNGTDPTAHAITVGWVGDSRAYWVSADPSTPSTVLTRDDTWAEYMVAQGALSEEEAHAAPSSGALVGWLGADAEEINGHVTTVTARAPGALVLCSDGLWNYLPEAEQLAAAVPDAADDPLSAARAYTRIANEAGGRDNISVVVIPIPLRPTLQGDPTR